MGKSQTIRGVLAVLLVMSGTGSVSAQFWAPVPVSAVVQVPYHGPITAESQAMQMEMQAMRQQIEYMQALRQWQAEMAYRNQMMWEQMEAARQQAEWDEYQQSRSQPWGRESGWQTQPPVSQVQVSSPTKMVPQSGNAAATLVGQQLSQQQLLNGLPRPSNPPRQVRIMLKPSRSSSGEMVLRVIGIVEEDVPGHRE